MGSMGSVCFVYANSKGKSNEREQGLVVTPTVSLRSLVTVRALQANSLRYTSNALRRGA